MSILLFFLFILGSVQYTLQDAPSQVTQFCRRFGHQTTIIDRKIYIDGGFINWSPLARYDFNYSSTSTRPALPAAC
jgi:hypothetical protein